MKKPFCIFCLLPLFINAHCQSYTKEDTVNIYRLLTNLPMAKGRLLYNKMGQSFDTIDFDGNIRGWSERQTARLKISSGDSIISAINICVNPIEYEMPVFLFLKKRGIIVDTSYLYRQLLNKETGILSNYIPEAVKSGGPGEILVNSDQKRLRRDDIAVYFSKIIFDSHNMAFVKVQYISGRRKSMYNSSEIIILEKNIQGWLITRTLREKSQSNWLGSSQN